MKLKKLSKIVPITMFFLFAFVLITSFMLANIYAKYHTSNSASDDARVAAFDIVVNVKDGTDNVISETIDYDFTPGSSVKLNVGFNGTGNEVRVKYTIHFSSYNNLPLTITYNSTDLFANDVVGEIAPQGSAAINNIIIEWPASHNSYLYSGEIDLITVTITVEQVD